MKKISLLVFIALMCSINIQSLTVYTNHFLITMGDGEKININFENNSTSKGDKKFKLTIVDPSGTKTVEEFSLGDMSRRKMLTLTVGSKIYVENSSKLNTLVGGKVPGKDEPFMTVMLRDKAQTIHLVEEENATQAVVEANARKSADKLKLDANATTETLVQGNTVTITYKSTDGKLLAEFDCDKKSGNVKNITDLRKKGEEVKKAEDKPEDKAEKKIKGLFGK